MSVSLASLIMTILGVYLAVGILFAFAFVAVGASQTDPAAKSMSLRVRALLLPGTALLWPLMAIKWIRREGPPVI